MSVMSIGRTCAFCRGPMTPLHTGAFCSAACSAAFMVRAGGVETPGEVLYRQYVEQAKRAETAARDRGELPKPRKLARQYGWDYDSSQVIERDAD